MAGDPMNEHIVYKNLESKLRLKYALDRLFALILLILTAPVFLFLALLIKLDGWLNPHNKGRVFYTEPRISAGRRFRIIKFRTVPASRLDWIKKKPESRSITGSDEVTVAGKLILKWYLDELPQLINILKGEMSFVGPRPHIADMYRDELDQGLLYRKYIKAGLLGVPQACKRHTKYIAIFERMARTQKSNIKVLNTLDGIYVRKCLQSSSLKILWFDFTLIVRGLIVVFRGS